MPFPEGLPGNREIQERFSQSVVDKPQHIIYESKPQITMHDLIMPDHSLVFEYQDMLGRTIGGLGLLPHDGKLPIAAHWEPHKNSKGQYFVEYDIKKPNPVIEDQLDLFHVYSYVLPPKSSTSIHAHAAIEFYILHAGEFTLSLNGEEAPLSRFAIVGPGVEHTGQTGEQPALITAITYNPLEIPRDQLHEYAWTQQDWTKERSEVFNRFLDSLERQ